jgi:ubiquinone/menaquinone biosynthesis C-methylase UbiE
MKYQALVSYFLEGPLLDVGIGTGIGMPSLIDYRPVVGVDLSIEMLGIAQQQIESNSRWGAIVSLVCASAEKLPFRSHVFPIVVSVTLIQNLVEPIQGTQEMHRVLQLSGLLGITALSKRMSIQQLKTLNVNRCRILAQLNNLGNEDVGIILQAKPPH